MNPHLIGLADRLPFSLASLMEALGPGQAIVRSTGYSSRFPSRRPLTYLLMPLVARKSNDAMADGLPVIRRLQRLLCICYLPLNRLWDEGRLWARSTHLPMKEAALQ